MKEINYKMFLDYISNQKVLEVDGFKFDINSAKNIKTLQPSFFMEEKTDVWSFPKNASWANHNEKKPEWTLSPSVIRNLLLKFSKENDIVLDPMMGLGNVIIESILLNRSSIGVDVNINNAYTSFARTDFHSVKEKLGNSKLYIGDARKLSAIKDKTVNYVIIHPSLPQDNNKNYIQGDISFIKDINNYIVSIKQIINESIRTLKNNGNISIIINDMKKDGELFSLSNVIINYLKGKSCGLISEIVLVDWNQQDTNSYGHTSLHSKILTFKKSFVVKNDNKSNPVEEPKLVKEEPIIENNNTNLLTEDEILQNVEIDKPSDTMINLFNEETKYEKSRKKNKKQNQDKANTEEI